MSVQQPHSSMLDATDSVERAPGAGTLTLFAVAIFTAAALLFTVLPLAG